MSPRVYVRSDLHQYGHDDDGSPFIGEVYYIVCEYADGTRFSYDERWHGCEVEAYFDEDGYPCQCFGDVRPKALRAARKVLNRMRSHLRDGGSLNLGGSHWERISSA